MDWWIWVLIGFALLAVEAATQMIGIGFFGLGAMVVGTLVALGVGGPLWVQLGIIAEPGGTVRVSNTVVTMNDHGLVAVGSGQLLSYGNNKTEGNTLPGAFNGTATQN